MTGQPEPDPSQGPTPDQTQDPSQDQPLDPTQDPALRDVVDQVRQAFQAGRPEQPESSVVLSSPAREQLRERLVAARAQLIAEREGVVSQLPTRPPAAAPSQAPDPTPGPPAPTPLVAGGGRRPSRRLALGLVAAAAAAVIAGTVVVQHGSVPLPLPPATVAAAGDVIGSVSADPAGAVRLSFSQPLDHAATVAALRLHPAAAVQTSWQGDVLEVTPTNGFAANSAYLLTIDAAVARTASGARLASDVQVGFGTAPAVAPGPAPAAPVQLKRATVAAAADGSEAVVTAAGAVLLTSGKPSAGTLNHEGLIRVDGSRVTKLAPATEAICVSRSGQSIAYLAKVGAVTQIVLAGAEGDTVSGVPVTADAGTPLGWIGDSEVSFVSGGRLRAVNRAGQVRLLSDLPVDPATDVLAIAPGGRFVYLPSAAAPGRVVDLVAGSTHQLSDITGTPAFSADGATVVWLQGTGRMTRLASAPSGGGPVLSVPLPVLDGDTVSDLAVSPDGSRLAYSVTHEGGTAQLRVASLPDGRTVAESDAGAGESPNWAPSGTGFTVLAAGPNGSQIQRVDTPAAVMDRRAAVEATVQAFANAQLSHDRAAVQSLATAGTAIPAVDAATRAAVVWVQQSGPAEFTARILFSSDATASDPVIRSGDETLHLRAKPAGVEPVVDRVDWAGLGAALPGPALTRLDTDAVPGSVLLSFDSDLDPGTVAVAVTLAGPGGAPVPATVRYDAPHRTVTVRPAGPAGSSGSSGLTVHVAPSLKDVAGTAISGPVDVSVDLAG